jgi:hypothetical protein
MAEHVFPYSTVPNRLKQVLEKAPTIGRPNPANTKWLKGLGYTGGNDASILSTMRKIGVIDSGGNPTSFYDAIRNKDGAAVAEHVRKAYKPLFDLYPDAYQKDDEALRNFFRSNTDAGDQTQLLMVRTFKVFAGLGDFDDVAAGASLQTPTPNPDETDETPRGRRRTTVHRESSGGGLTLNVNIQLQLPPSADGEVYDKLFEAMGKHLKGLASFE